MIRKLTKLTELKLDTIMNIWLKVNTESYDFINGNYWSNQYDSVKIAIQQATIIAFCEQKRIVGFVGLKDNYIAGIFVEKEFQNQGIGKKLLFTAKEGMSTLSLAVYSKNEKALAFYLKEGFEIFDKQIDELTIEEELIMIWHNDSIK